MTGITSESVLFFSQPFTLSGPDGWAYSLKDQQGEKGLLIAIILAALDAGGSGLET